MSLDALLVRGLLPDAVVRAGIRRLRVQRLREEDRGTEEARRAHRDAYVAALRTAPIAVHAQDTNAFFLSCAELWGYAGGEEWLVSHYLFARR